MSLFSQLRRLDSSELEDFNTEIVAAVLKYSKENTIAWLRSEGLTTMVDPDEVSITTHEELDALDDHLTGSRPDMTIRLTKDERKELIFIESKIGSSEGPSQLERYADHLEKAKGYTLKTLVYITRNYDPKENPKRSEVEFRPKRWAGFYAFFDRSRTKSPLTIEMLHFMKENNMDKSNQFTNIDVLALTNFSKAYGLMVQTMWEEVDAKFTKICGRHSDQGDTFLQLRNNNQYTMYCNNKQGSCRIFLGYWFKTDAATDSPSLGMSIAVNPKADDRSQIVGAMKDFSKEKNGIWWDYHLDDEKQWGCLIRDKFLQEFLCNPEGDHVQAITSFFIECLNDFQELITRNPGLIL